jgi:hypothetical protein
MKIGMLWFDKNKLPTLAIGEAAAYYKNKYGQSATIVYCNPRMDVSNDVQGIRVEKSRSVQPHCYWIGVEK